MTLAEFAQLVPGLAAMSHVDKLKHLAWYVLTQEGKERFTTTDMRRCYELLHYASPANLSGLLQQMADKKPPDLLKDSRGSRLEGRVKEQLDTKYGVLRQLRLPRHCKAYRGPSRIPPNGCS